MPPTPGAVVGSVNRHLKAMPLRVRLIAVLSVLIATAVLLTTMATAYLVNRDLKGRIDDELRSAAVPVAQQALDRTTSSTLPTGYAVILLPVGGLPLQVTYPTGVDDRPAVPPLALDDARVASGRPFTVGSVSGDHEWRVIAGRINNRNATYAVAVPLEGVEHTVHQLLLVSGLIGLGALLACGLTGWYAIRRAFRPLRQIEDTAAAIAEGDLTKRIPVPGTRDEVTSLSRSLNAMLAQIEHSFAVREASEERMRQFVSDASHELRTPLATVRGYAELYRQGAVRAEPDVASAMGRIEGEATRMGGLVEDLLTLARLDEEPTAVVQQVDLTVLAADATQDARALAPDRHITMVRLEDAVGPAVVVGTESRLRQVLTNLLGNAVTHTPAGTPIEIAVGVDGARGTAVVEVRDHGPGIDAQVAGKVFERFYRADRARSRASGGSGLGLAIVAAIVHAHGGRVGVAPTPGGGATFVVEIPTATSQAAHTRLSSAPA